MVNKILLTLIAIFSVIYIFRIGLEGSDFIMLFKLIPMFLIIILALLTRAPQAKTYYTLISIGLVFCAIGDYTLQWFIIGLIFFLIGHLFYIAAFLSTNVQQSPKSLLAVLVFYGAVMAVIIAGGLWQDGDVVMAFAVVAYISVILTMGWTAWRTKSNYAMIGAILFIISDSVLALNKFTVAIPAASEIIMITYYGAQVLLALSISQYSVNRTKMVQ